MTYKELVERDRREWTGRTVEYEGRAYKVIDVDYNGAIMIDLPGRFTDTTAVSRFCLKIIDE